MPKENKNKKDKKHFFKEFKAELKKVIWPTPKQLVNNTVAVISIVLLTAVIVFVLDLAFEKINTYGINKLKGVVDSKNEVSVNIEQGNQSTDENSNNEENSQANNEENNNETSEKVSE